MKLLANENFPITSYKILKAEGFDIEHIGVTFPSIRDENVMEKAIQENRVILTFDRDYGELVFKYGYKPLAVIYLRFKDFPPEMPGIFLAEFLRRNDLDIIGNFTVVDEQQIRQRKI